MGVKDCVERSDNEIIFAVLHGQVDAYEEIISRHKKRIYSVVYHLTPDVHEANDLFQEALIKIFQVLNRYDGKGSFAGWAVKVATNHCIDRLRRRKDLLPKPDEELSELPDSRGNPEEEYLRTERTVAIHKAIWELPEKYRLPIILFHQEEMTYEEIAAILRLPMSMVKNRLYRARLILRDKLAEREEGVRCHALHITGK